MNSIGDCDELEALELLSFLNSNNKLIKADDTNLQQQQPPRKKIKISENDSRSKESTTKSRQGLITAQSADAALFNVDAINRQASYVGLTLSRLESEEDNQVECYLQDSWYGIEHYLIKYSSPTFASKVLSE